MTAETRSARWEVVAERQAWYEQQIALAEGQWAAAFLDRWECGDDVPSKEHYVALWLAERAAPQPADAQQQGQESGGEVIQRHVVTKYRDGSVHVADVAAAECPHDWGQDEAHEDWARCYKCGISRRKPLAQQPAAEAKGQAVAECHCATCTCAPGMTPAVRFDTSPAAQEGAVRDHLIALGWTPPGAQQPAAVDEAMVERALRAWREAVVVHEGNKPAIRAALTAALATQRQEPKS